MKIYRISDLSIEHIDCLRIGWCKHHLPRAVAEKEGRTAIGKYRPSHRCGGDAGLPRHCPDGPYIRLSNIGAHDPRAVVGYVHANGPAAVAYLKTLYGY